MMRGNAAAAAIEATETYRVSQKVSIQIATPTSAAIGANPKSAPAEVATPFPPLKRSHTGKECPSTLDIAATIPNISGEFHSGCTRVAIKIDIFTEPKPFKKSAAKTGYP
jgi:hypothetical protein